MEGHLKGAKQNAEEKESAHLSGDSGDGKERTALGSHHAPLSTISQLDRPQIKASRSLSMIVSNERRISPPVPVKISYLNDKFGNRMKCQYSMPSRLNNKYDPNNQYQIHHAMLDERIINCKLSIAAKKDFGEEVRALIDVRKFVSDSFILTDITEVRIGAIVERIVDRLVDCRSLGEEVAAEAKSLLFVEQSSFNVLLANTMQGLYKSRADGRLAYDQSWVVATSNLTTLFKRQVAIARFPNPVNFGRQSQEVRFLIIVLAPSKEKLTKSAWETGRTFATMFTDINFRRRLLRAKSQDEFKMELLTQAENLARDNSEEMMNQTILSKDSDQSIVSSNGQKFDTSWSIPNQDKHHSRNRKTGCCGADTLLGSLGSGLLNDFKRRSKFYLSDFTDGVLGDRSLYKTISTTIFLYFSVLLPCIAFGVVDTNNTEGHIDPKKTMIGQALGGLFFALFSGQPLIVIMTTAPLCIYVKVIYQISLDLEVEFSTFYACVGLWMAIFLIVMSVTNVSNLMKYCTRSTEDIFAIFTAFAFGSDGVKEAIRSFDKYYWEVDCSSHIAVQSTRMIPESSLNSTSGSSLPRIPSSASNISLDDPSIAMLPTDKVVTLADQGGSDIGQQVLYRCQRETCIMFLFLMCGTLWLANSFSSFDKTPYLSSRKREIIKDYALAISVLIFSFVGSFLFSDVKLDIFEFGDFNGLNFVQMGPVSLSVLATSALLGFMLSVLFYIDQNICGAMVNNAPYKLKKGDYFHMDLFVVAVLNGLLSLAGLPWMHGKLPHSHLHAKALADYEERVDEGHVHQTIVNIRETRLTAMLCSILIGLSLYSIPYPLSYIPLPVLSGVFLYTALAEFKSNSMVERICLLFTEQAAYPPNHYIRRCPQREIHFFTLTQIFQLAIVSFVGFYPNPYVNMAFPLIVATFVPIRVCFLPRLIESRYLNSLDRSSSE